MSIEMKTQDIHRAFAIGILLVLWLLTEVTKYFGFAHLPCCLLGAVSGSKALYAFVVILILLVIVTIFGISIRRRWMDVILLSVVYGVLFSIHLMRDCFHWSPF